MVSRSRETETKGNETMVINGKKLVATTQNNEIRFWLMHPNGNSLVKFIPPCLSGESYPLDFPFEFHIRRLKVDSPEACKVMKACYKAALEASKRMVNDPLHAWNA